MQLRSFEVDQSTRVPVPCMRGDSPAAPAVVPRSLRPHPGLGIAHA